VSNSVDVVEALTAEQVIRMELAVAMISSNQYQPHELMGRLQEMVAYVSGRAEPEPAATPVEAPPAPEVLMPSVIGCLGRDAITQLHALGASVGIEPGDEADVTTWVVVNQTPPPGTRLGPGATTWIDLDWPAGTVSAGPR
jgi:PASTA domain